LAEPTPEVPNRNLGNTDLDMSQPDGIPRPRERNPDGTFKEVTPPEPAKNSSTPPAHPSYLLEMARNYGFTEADCAKMTTDSLGIALTQAQRRDNEWRERLQSTQTPAKAPEPEPELDLGLKPEEYDEKIVGAFNKLKTRDAENAKALKELREELAQTKARDQERSIAQAKSMIDDAFEALGPEYAAYFGAGSGDDLKASDPATFRRRMVVLQETGLDARVTSGKQLLSKLKAKADELFKIEKKSTETPVSVERPQRRGRYTREEWEAGGTAVPTQRESDQEPFGRERAIKNAERRARENGVAVNPSTAKEDQDLRNTFKRS